jgi:Na+/proline symporter
MSTIAATIIFVIYAAILIVLALRDRHESPAQYMIAKREVGAFATMASIAGNLRDGAGLAAWVILGIYFGFGALWLSFGLCAALVLLGFLAPVIRERAGRRDYIAANQLIEEMIGSATARISVLLIAGTALLYSAAQMFVAGNLFAAAMSIPPVIGVVTISAVVGVYLGIGGYQTTIRTGIVQWFIVMLILLLPWLLGGAPEPGIPIGSITSPGLLNGFAFFMISFLVVISSTDIWQLMFSASSPRSARVGLMWTVPVYLAISLGLVFFAKAVQHTVSPGTPPESAFFALFASPHVPAMVLSIAGMFVVASIMSTLDSQVFLFVSTVVRHLMPRVVTSNDPKMERVTKAVMAVTIVALALIASTIGNIVEFLFGAVTLGTILFPLLLISVFSRPDAANSSFVDIGICCVVIVSAVVYVWLFASGYFKALPYTLVPATVSAIGCLFIWMLGKRPASCTGRCSPHS